MVIAVCRRARFVANGDYRGKTDSGLRDSEDQSQKERSILRGIDPYERSNPDMKTAPDEIAGTGPQPVSSETGTLCHVYGAKFRFNTPDITRGN